MTELTWAPRRAGAIRTVGPKLLFWSLAIVFPAPLVVILHTALADVAYMRTTVLYGVVAYSWWLLGIALSVRPSWLDRRVGLPSIYAFHGVLGLLAIIPAYLHSQNLYAHSRLAASIGEWALYGSFALLCLAILFMSGWLVDRSVTLTKLKRKAEIVVRHQVSLWMHRLNLVVVLLIWLHVHLIDRTTAILPFMILFDVYTVAAFTLYVWKKWVAPAGYLTGTVQDVTHLNDRTLTVTIALDRECPRLRPGDFFFMRVEGSGAVGREWHPFSVTTHDHDVVVFTIRRLGAYTRRLSALREGTAVRLEGPFGRFAPSIDERDEHMPLVLIGMGAGVAPLLSLAQAYAPARRVHLLWTVHSGTDLYYRDLIEDLRRHGNGHFTVTERVGRFSKDELATALAGDTASALFVVVGPNTGVLRTRRTLRLLGAPDHNIVDERLTM